MTKRVLAALGWLVLFAAVGVALLQLLPGAASGKVRHLTPRLAATGAELGTDIYLLLLFFARLPGVRVAPSGALGPVQAVWALLGFGVMLAAGGLAAFNLLIVGNLLLRAAQLGWQADLSGNAAMLASAYGGETAAALWICWFLVRVSPARLVSGAADGIAWRPASPAAYRAAWLCALGIIGVVIVLFHLIPPDLHTLNNLPMAKLFQGSGWQLAALLLLVVVVGPVVEELAFRGAAFAGFAHRFGPVAATVITTLVFMAVHAAEKRYYLPGFIDVGLMATAACWLRVRYGSIQPGILLHVLYNFGLLLAAGWMH